MSVGPWVPGHRKHRQRQAGFAVIAEGALTGELCFCCISPTDISFRGQWTFLPSKPGELGPSELGVN